MALLGGARNVMPRRRVTTGRSVYKIRAPQPRGAAHLRDPLRLCGSIRFVVT